MAQTLAQITKQIEKLQKEADALRQAELKGVVDRIKVAIVHYGLTPEQLGFGKSGGKKTSNSLPAAKGGNKVVIAKFSNDAGQIWSGRGPRPRWLREALANGRSLDEFSTTARKRSTEAISNVEQEMGIAAAETPISKRQAKANSKNSARAHKAPAAKHTAAASKNLPRSKAKRLNQVSAKVASAPNAEKSGIAILSPAAA
jgi:DNA-binding protein H-NS